MANLCFLSQLQPLFFPRKVARILAFGGKFMLPAAAKLWVKLQQLRRPVGYLPETDRPEGQRRQPADQQPGNRRALPLGLALDDVPAPVSGAPTSDR